MPLVRIILSVFLVAGARAGAAAEGIAYHDGTEVSGAILQIDGEIVQIADRSTVRSEGSGESSAGARSIALYEIGVIHFRSGATASPRRSVDDVPGPVVCFRSGQLLAGHVTGTAIGSSVGVDEGPVDSARVKVASAGVLDVPLELLWGFRLHRHHRTDALFRTDLAAAIRATSETPRASVVPQDWVYVVRGRQLLKVGGVFRSLDDRSLSMDYKGKTRRVPRSKVFGVILAPVATRRVESGYPAVFRLTSGDEFPAFLVGMKRSHASGRELLVRFRGSRPDARQSVPIELVQQVRFFSDRVTFLSDLAPVRTRENPLVGSTTAFPWRRDRSTSGDALKLGGKTYRKGLGVHSYSSLEFDIGGRYSTFAATIGLVDRERNAAALADDVPVVAGVTFRVFADDKVLFEMDMRGAAKGQSVLLPVTRVERLRLEVDYGKDGVDFGDHAVWAEARVIKD